MTPKQLEKIEITSEPNKTTYIQGQNFDSTGMQVTATYNSGKTAIINKYSIPNGQNLTAGMTSVKIVYTENGETKEYITTSGNYGAFGVPGLTLLNKFSFSIRSDDVYFFVYSEAKGRNIEIKPSEYH